MNDPLNRLTARYAMIREEPDLGVVGTPTPGNDHG